MRIVDGLFRYSGRIDDQVKVRGHRVELGEVEAHLLAHPAVRLATVLAPADAYGARGLVGYVEADGAVTETELRRHLADRLPGYLVPDRIAVLPRLPLAGNGKVDRQALPGLPRSAAVPHRRPSDPVLARLAGIAAEVLELPEVEVDAPLSEYGCHSLAAARICVRAGADFGVTVPVVGFLREPTVRALAGLVADAEAGAPMHVSGVDRHPLTRMQRQLWALRQVTGNPAVTLVAVRLGLTADAGSLSAEAVSPRSRSWSRGTRRCAPGSSRSAVRRSRPSRRRPPYRCGCTTCVPSRPTGAGRPPTRWPASRRGSRSTRRATHR